MLFTILCIILAVAFAVCTIFFNQCRTNFEALRLQISGEPITNDEILESSEQIDNHLYNLQGKLQSKEVSLKETKNKFNSLEENILRLDLAKNQIRKFYFKLKNEIVRTEAECRELKDQIKEYVILREDLKSEIIRRQSLLSRTTDNAETTNTPELMTSFNHKFGGISDLDVSQDGNATLEDGKNNELIHTEALIPNQALFTAPPSIILNKQDNHTLLNEAQENINTPMINEHNNLPFYPNKINKKGKLLENLLKEFNTDLLRS